MGLFTNGVLVGIGAALLFTPKTGKEVRNFLVERYGYLRGIPPENPELKQQVQQMSERVQDVQQMANRAAEMGNSVQSDLSKVAQQTGTNVPPAKQGANNEQTQPLPPKKPTV